MSTHETKIKRLSTRDTKKLSVFKRKNSNANKTTSKSPQNGQKVKKSTTNIMQLPQLQEFQEQRKKSKKGSKSPKQYQIEKQNDKKIDYVQKYMAQ